ncbi:MAG: hypothetical protein ABI367_11540 [Mucilaginibacter sp.]
MIPEKLKKLIALLTAKTLEKKAIWNKGSYDNQFKLSLSDGIAIAVHQWEDNFQNPFWEVVIFNDQGDPIEKYETSTETSKEDFSLLKAFHKAANDRYYKVEETMDTLLHSIESQDVIGKKDELITFAPPPEEDDLPF